MARALMFAVECLACMAWAQQPMSVPGEVAVATRAQQAVPVAVEVTGGTRTQQAVPVTRDGGALPATGEVGSGLPVLLVQTVGGQGVFHVGERITLRLSFTAAADKTFEMTTASYDRSGRMNYEQFEVSPAGGWADPMAGYFGSAGGMIGGGMFSMAALSATPETIPLNLNEWVRFDVPGDYTVRVTSRRVSETAKRFGEGVVAVTSNAVVLHVVAAEPVWEQTTLNRALAVLRQTDEPGDVPLQAKGGMTAEARQAARAGALADVRFLGSDRAVAVMAAGLRDDRRDQASEYSFGIVGLPRAKLDVALEALRVQMAAADFPVGGWFLRTAGYLVAASGAAPPDFAGTRAGEAEMWREAVADLPRKVGPARAATALMLLESVPKEGDAADVNAADKARLAAVVAASFAALTPEQQLRELRENWQLLRPEGMLPELKVLAVQPLRDPGSRVTTTEERRELKAVALERWYELEPESAEREALRQVGSAEPQLRANDLAFLGKRTLPQFEPVWAGALQRETDFERENVLLELLVRFGTGAAVGQVEARLDENVGRWACAPQAAALAYTVRWDAERARGLLERAEAARGPCFTACRHSVLQDTARLVGDDPVLEETALAGLTDGDAEVTLDALIYLHDYGSVAAQEPVWEQYVAWSDAWAGKAESFEKREAGQLVGNWQAVGMGESLARTLLAGQGWVADASLRARVMERCVGEQMCGQARQLVEQAKEPYRVTMYRFRETESYQVGPYAAKSMELFRAKVKQFAKGTKFTVAQAGLGEEQVAMEAEARRILEEAGMVVVP